ncbi:hypothetical protein [Treponema sp. R6D11]
MREEVKKRIDEVFARIESEQEVLKFLLDNNAGEKLVETQARLICDRVRLGASVELISDYAEQAEKEETSRLASAGSIKKLVAGRAILGAVRKEAEDAAAARCESVLRLLSKTLGDASKKFPDNTSISYNKDSVLKDFGRTNLAHSGL